MPKSAQSQLLRLAKELRKESKVIIASARKIAAGLESDADAIERKARGAKAA